VLKLPVVLLRSAFTPLAVLLLPVVLAFKAPEPNAVLDATAPAPLPTVKPDRVASVVEVIAPVTASAPESTAASVEVPVADSVVNAPVLAVEAPTVVPFTVPPVIATVAAFCVEIVPRPKLVRDVIAEAKSDKLLALNAYAVSAPVAVTPKLVRAVAASVAPVPPRTTESVPVVPATIGSPVAFVSVAADGVPKLGVVKVGEVLNAMPPEPVTFCPNAVATPVPNEVIPVPPLATGKTPVALARA